MRIVFVTCPPNRGAEILKTLVQERLVAGGNIIPSVFSIYWWQDKVCEEPEEILLMETSDSRVEAMMARIKEIHPYKVPKILTFEPREGFSDYLAWVDTETRPTS
jgi:periplasmic divalent cation tolerance protein